MQTLKYVNMQMEFVLCCEIKQEHILKSKKKKQQQTSKQTKTKGKSSTDIDDCQTS